MISLTLLELLYFVLIFFGIIIGTLLTLILIRILKILGVISEITGYYWTFKKYIGYYSQALMYWGKYATKKEHFHGEEEIKNPVL